MSSTSSLFPVALSPSPVREAFQDIEWDAVAGIRLSPQERSQLKSVEANVVSVVVFLSMLLLIQFSYALLLRR